MKNETSLGQSLEPPYTIDDVYNNEEPTPRLNVWVDGGGTKAMTIEEMDDASNYGVAFVSTVANHWWVLEEDLMRFMHANGRYVQGVEVKYFDEDRDELIEEMEAF